MSARRRRRPPLPLELGRTHPAAQDLRLGGITTAADRLRRRRHLQPRESRLQRHPGTAVVGRLRTRAGGVYRHADASAPRCLSPHARRQPQGLGQPPARALVQRARGRTRGARRDRADRLPVHLRHAVAIADQRAVAGARSRGRAPADRTLAHGHAAQPRAASSARAALAPRGGTRRRDEIPRDPVRTGGRSRPGLSRRPDKAPAEHTHRHRRNGRHLADLVRRAAGAEPVRARHALELQRHDRWHRTTDTSHARRYRHDLGDHPNRARRRQESARSAGDPAAEKYRRQRRQPLHHHYADRLRHHGHRRPARVQHPRPDLG